MLKIHTIAIKPRTSENIITQTASSFSDIRFEKTEGLGSSGGKRSRSSLDLEVLHSQLVKTVPPTVPLPPGNLCLLQGCLSVPAFLRPSDRLVNQSSGSGFLKFAVHLSLSIIDQYSNSFPIEFRKWMTILLVSFLICIFFMNLHFFHEFTF